MITIRETKTISNWKRLEREVARKLGGKRITRGADFGVSAGDVESIPGTLSDLFSIECKYRTNFPVLVRDGLKQAKEYDGNRIPLLVLKEKGMNGEIVCLKLDDLVELLDD